MSGLTIIGPAEAIAASLRGLADDVQQGRIAEATFRNNGPGLDLTLTIEPDESDAELGIVAELM